MTAAPAGAGIRAPVRPRRAITVAILLAAAPLLCGIAIEESAVPTRAVVWASLALACYAAGLLCLVGARAGGVRLASWKFGPWILLWCGVTFGLATVTWSAPQTSTAAQITVSSVLRALWLVAIGLTFWAAGYFVGPGRPARRLAARGIAVLDDHLTQAVRGRFTPWILYGIGTAGRVAATVTTGRFGYVGDVSSAVSTATGYGQLLSALSLLAPLGVCTAALHVYRDRLPGARITLAILFLTELAFGAAAGGKASFVIALLAVAIPMSVARRRLPKAAAIAGALIFLAIIIPFNQAYRSAARGGSATLSPSEAIHEAPGIFRQTLTGHNVIAALPNSASYLLQRIREIDNPAIILQRTPGQIAFSGPFQLIEAPLVDIVPRAIWPGKPILATGYQFSQQYYGLSAAVYTSSAITPIGDLYRHGGWIPVIAGMFVLGCGVRLLDDVLDVRADSHAIFLVLLLFPSLVSAEDDWSTFLAGIPGTVAIWLFALALTFRTRRST
jgi:hypothetical protein